MKKRLYALVLVLVLCLQCFGAYAAYEPYTPGDITYAMSFDDPLKLTNASVTEWGELTLNAGGSAEFDMLFLLDVASVEVEYSAKTDGVLNMTIEENSYDIAIDDELDTVTHNVIDRKGSHVVKLTSDCEVTITSIVFTKIEKNHGIRNTIIVELNDYDKALQSTVVVKLNSVALKVNGAMRYIDYDDITLTPMVLDGRVYLPVHTAARALSVYYEDYSDLSYVYLSDDNNELYAGPNGRYTIQNGVKKALGSFEVYKDGKTYVPIRQMAELFGKTVEFKDGFVIIDDRICVKNIINSKSVMRGLNTEFAKFDASLLSTGKVYHVSKAAYAKDTNDGSENFPFSTIQKAADVAQAGDIVIIHEGVYRETVIPRNDGTATAPIKYISAEGEDVTISAFEKVSGFEIYDEEKGIYTTSIPKSMGFDRNFIIMDDEIIREGRHPNTDTKVGGPGPHPEYDDVNILRATMGDVSIKGSTTALVQTATSDIDLNQDEVDYWKGGSFVTFAGSAWTLSYAKILSSKKGSMDVQGFEKGMYGINRYYGAKHPSDYGYITNHYNTVDLPGEWYVDHDRNQLYMIPPEGSDPKTLTVEVKQRQRVIDMTDRKFVQFININTRGGGLTMAGDSEMCVLNGGTHKYITHFGYTGGKDTHTCRFYDFENQWTNKEDAPEWGEAGFFSHGINNAFINADISYSAAAGIFLTGLYTYVENNVVAHTSYAGTYPSGITIEGVKWDEYTAKYGGHTVVGNTSWGAGRGCFYLSRNFTSNATDRLCYPVLACDVGYNHFYLGSVTARDSGVTYTHGTTFGNDWIKTKIHHNVGHDNVTHKNDNFMANVFYYDGQSVLSESFSNVAFSTYEDYLSNPTSNYQIRYQGTGESNGQTDYWGNVALGVFPGGFDGLKGYHYPYQKPFHVGAVREGDERFMLNYNKYSLENTRLASDGVLSGSAYIDADGFVRFPDKDASIAVSDLEFYDTGSYIQLTYTADRYKFDGSSIPQFSITVTQNGQEVTKVNKPVGYNYKDALDGQGTMKLYLKGDISGKADVKISADADFLRFSKIRVNPCNFEEENAKRAFPSDASVIHIGSADTWISGGAGAPKFFNSFSEGSVDADTISYITQSANHTYVYKNREITNDSSKVTFRVGSGRFYSNLLLKIHLGSEDGEVIGEIDVYPLFADYEVGSVWSTHNITVDLKRVLPAGTYDFYVENVPYQTERNDQNSTFTCTTDQYYMAFHN